MKKLMIAAAAAAVGFTSSAELCVEDTAGDACAVYNIKFTFKTLAAKRQSCADLIWLIDDDFDGVWTRTDRANVTISDTTTAAGGAHDQTVFPHVRAHKRNLWWADNATRTFDGILWQCRANCFEGLAFWAPAIRGGWRPGRINYALWETRSRTSIAFPVLRYYTRLNRSQYSWWTRNAAWQFRFLGRYGQNAQKVAAYWTPTVMRGFINAAGFGTFDANNKRMTSVSGNAVGMIAPLNTGAQDSCGRAARFFVQVAFMCEDFIQWCCDGCYAGVETVPASGTWSLRYNASLSRGTKSLAKILPDYAVFGPAVFGSAGFGRIRAFLNANLYNVTLDSNGIFYAPRFLTAYLVDEEGNEIEPDTEYDEDEYLNDLAIRAEKAMSLEIFADLDNAGQYVQQQLAFVYSELKDGKLSYYVGDPDAVTITVDDEGAVTVEGATEVAPDDDGKYNFKAVEAEGLPLNLDLEDYAGILEEKEEAYPDGTTEKKDE